MNLRLSENVRYYRIVNHMTQQELADAVGYVHKTSISNIEKGKCDVPLSVVTKLAAVFNVEESLLLFGISVKPLKEHEYELLNAYREHPEFHSAIDTMLGIEKKSGESTSRVG